MGDLNAEPDSPAMQYLAGLAPLVSAGATTPAATVDLWREWEARNVRGLVCACVCG